MSESLKQKTFKGTVWSSIERFSVQGISFIVMVIMARVLTPDDYGLIGMLTVLIFHDFFVYFFTGSTSNTFHLV